jgi:hypothetical protein
VTKLSATAYAAHRKRYGLQGGTQPAVTKALNQGRLTAPAAIKNEKGQWEIDPKLADVQWAETTKIHSHFNFSVRSPSDPEEPPEPASPSDPPPLPAPPALQSVERKNNMTKAEVQRLREIVRLKRENIALSKEEGEVGLIEDYEREARRVAVITRESMMALTDRLPGQLSVMNDENDVRELLTEEITKALRSLKL